MSVLTKRTAQVRGTTMAYVDEGNGRPIVLIHGNPTSSYLWRNVIPHVTDRAVLPGMERDNGSVTAAFHECRSAVGADCARADAWPSSMAVV